MKIELTKKAVAEVLNALAHVTNIDQMAAEALREDMPLTARLRGARAARLREISADIVEQCEGAKHED